MLIYFHCYRRRRAELAADYYMNRQPISASPVNYGLCHELMLIYMMAAFFRLAILADGLYISLY